MSCALTPLCSPGDVQACIGKDGMFTEPIGWITLMKPDAPEEVNLEEVPTLASTFDLKSHTAKALTKALRLKLAGLAKPGAGGRKKKAEGSLPFMERGRKPQHKTPDDGLPSRHAVVTAPASMILLINCANAAFEVVEWSGTLPFDLPGEQSFDLISKKKKRKLGRVRIPSELGMPFLERVEFADEWVPGEECGLEHDGWQGEGVIDIDLTCGKDTATIRLYPWLAYGCSVGARLNIKSVSASQGQCATVHRILGDDRIVARVDGFPRDAGVKAEVIVDLAPHTVVPTSGPGFDKGTKLLLLYRNKLVDAIVMEWTGKINFQVGSHGAATSYQGLPGSAMGGNCLASACHGLPPLAGLRPIANLGQRSPSSFQEGPRH